MATTTMPRGMERRRHQRVPADLYAGCRRLGSRSSLDDQMHVIDLSQGGARLEGGADIRTGDVLLVNLDLEEQHLSLKGLVVQARANVTRPDPVAVHVAWTSVSDDARQGLSRVLETLTPATA